MLFQTHGRPILRAVLSGFAGVAPRSATQNLIELLSTIASKYPSETRGWMDEILFAVCFDVSASCADRGRLSLRMISCSPRLLRRPSGHLSRLWLGGSSGSSDSLGHTDYPLVGRGRQRGRERPHSNSRSSQGDWRERVSDMHPSVCELFLAHTLLPVGGVQLSDLSDCAHSLRVSHWMEGGRKRETSRCLRSHCHG